MRRLGMKTNSEVQTRKTGSWVFTVKCHCRVDFRDVRDDANPDQVDEQVKPFSLLLHLVSSMARGVNVGW